MKSKKNLVSIIINCYNGEKYLKEALKTFHSEEVIISFSGEIKPFIITGKDDPSLLHLVLPVRLD